MASRWRQLMRRSPPLAVFQSHRILHTECPKISCHYRFINVDGISYHRPRNNSARKGSVAQNQQFHQSQLWDPNLDAFFRRHSLSNTLFWAFQCNSRSALEESHTTTAKSPGRLGFPFIS
ncbi:hypothetical protein O181_004207 [Austropuccinia psidii MF-1]|uniref:Uncharacterized protein n=1 Tax=Austropuccinia psidii MF-1 TaxID=1389203 RepID=A0A9Q3BGB5_9BASI|nr:hypothetical protein [Austropuccinia psidii MF-1]